MWKRWRLAGRHWHAVWLARGRVWRSAVHGRAVRWVDRLESSILHHGLERARVEQFGLLDQAVDHDLGCGLHLLLDKANHGDIALDLDVLANVQALWRRRRAQLLWLRWFAWLVSANLPLIPEVYIGRGVGVSLQAKGKVVKNAAKLDGAAAHLANAGNVLDAL